MEHFIEFIVFFGKILVVFLFIAALLLLIVALAARQKLKPDLQIENLTEKWHELKNTLQAEVLSKKDFKQQLKANKKKEKDDFDKDNIFLLKFEGDMQAKAVDQLRDEITAVLSVAKAGDEVVVSIESPGGTVHGYGLGAAQLLRIKSANIKLTACIDRVAASGGYMMACTADQIIAAPFSIIGSIGVLAQVPNFHKLLKKHDVDYEEISSGEYKRTVSLLGEITDKGRAKFLEQISDTHLLFKDFVKSKRPKVQIEEVGTGEYWFGIRALKLNLVDELKTSDEYLLDKIDMKNIYSIKYSPKKSLGQKIQEAFGASIDRTISKIFEKATELPRL